MQGVEPTAKPVGRSGYGGCGVEGHGLSPDLARFVHARLAEQAGARSDSVGIGDAAMRHGLALLLDTWGASWGLDAAGRVWCIEWGHESGDPCSVTLESDPRCRAGALHQGSLLYPEIRTLVPPRPVDAYTCPGCDCQGALHEFAEYRHITGRDPPLCYCFGLGWLPRGTRIPGIELT
jgi:hypothetical protein